MELLDGVPLDAYLERAGRLSVEEGLALLSAIAKALAAAHEAGIAHRDLKPENVFLELDPEGTVHPKILDFGMAKLLAPGSLPIHKTRSGTPIGSPRYMSPEQCRGVKVDHRTDVYSFGCMAHRMFTGSPPFEARTALELMLTHVSVVPPPMSSVFPEGLRELDEPVLKMLAKLPDERPQTMLAAYESLAEAAERAGHTPCAPTIPISPLLREMVAERDAIATTALDVSKPRRPRPSGARSLGLRSRRLGWPLAIGAIALLAAAYFVAKRPRPEASPSPMTSAEALRPTPLPSATQPTALATESTSAGPPPTINSALRPAPVRRKTLPSPGSAVPRDLEDPY
jgi:serine/threonine-protein kinase